LAFARIGGAEYPIEKVMEENFDGYFLSNGPGDPEPVSYGIHSAKTIISKKKSEF
jgi:carbamoyl-phosphate synthase small subunit